MHSVYEGISENLLLASLDALTLANTHATYNDRGLEHWGTASVIEAARSGELLLKAIIAKSHPLLIFKDIFNLDQINSEEIQLDDLISHAKTHDFQNLPKILWVVAKQRIPDQPTFDTIKKMRNSIQHFFHHETLLTDATRARDTTLRFIFLNLDPLFKRNFDKYAIEYITDDVGYDYLVAQLLRRGLRFSVPPNFNLSEVNVEEEIDTKNSEYCEWFSSEMKRIGRSEVYERPS